MKFSSTLFIVMLFSVSAHAQTVDNTGNVGVNTDQIFKDALLQLESDTSALLLPRVADTTAIATPKPGMIIYDQQTKCIRGYADNQWTRCFDGIKD